MLKPDLRFLVIDDFSTMRKIVRKALTEMGHANVEEAADGQIAWDLLKLCRADDCYAKTPFVMVTAEGEQKQIIQALKLDCTDYLIKPYATNAIKEKITKLLNEIANQEAA